MGLHAAHSAHALIAGCPERYTLLHSNPYKDNNWFLFGSTAVVTDAHRFPARRPTRASKALSGFFPAVWYSCFQTYIPYNSDGLDGKGIIREVLENLPASEYAGDESESRYRSRVWRILVNMHGDQKWYSLRFGGFLLSLIFKWLFNGELFVNVDVCARLRELAPRSTFVYVALHSSSSVPTALIVISLQTDGAVPKQHHAANTQVRANAQEPPGLPHAQLHPILRRLGVSPHRRRYAPSPQVGTCSSTDPATSNTAPQSTLWQAAYQQSVRCGGDRARV
jgi:hypothetical protein